MKKEKKLQVYPELKSDDFGLYELARKHKSDILISNEKEKNIMSVPAYKRKPNTMTLLSKSKELYCKSVTTAKKEDIIPKREHAYFAKPLIYRCKDLLYNLNRANHTALTLNNLEKRQAFQELAFNSLNDIEVEIDLIFTQSEIKSGNPTEKVSSACSVLQNLVSEIRVLLRRWKQSDERRIKNKQFDDPQDESIAQNGSKDFDMFFDTKKASKKYLKEQKEYQQQMAKTVTLKQIAEITNNTQSNVKQNNKSSVKNDYFIESDDDSIEQAIAEVLKPKTKHDDIRLF